MDNYFFDYRIGEIRKNLDTTFLAPEMYNELIVITNDGIYNGEQYASNSCYKYIYEDKNGKQIEFFFDIEQLLGNDMTFDSALNKFLSSHNFEAEQLIRKFWFITEELFWSLPHTIY